MGWRTLLFAYATVMALGLASRAEPADTAPLRTSTTETTEQPRYSTMIPPSEDQLYPSGPTAPTQKIAVSAAQPVSSQSQPAAPRYATQTPPANENVTVNGLRASQEELYRLGPGDKLRLTVYNETDLSGDFTIDGQGYVRLPLVGQVQAAGLTSYGLESHIADAFVKGGFLLNPRVAVEITTYRPFYILGEVSKPGEYAYVNAMSAPNAIALAGGYTDRAVDSTLYIRHQGETKEHAYRADETTRIRPGDVIRVERTGYWSVMTILAPLISPFGTAAYLLK